MSKKNLKKVIIIGGSDPSGGAGIQADLHTLQLLKVPVVSVITAVTAQTKKKFFSYQSVSPQNFKDQLSSVSQEAKKSVVKIGMLGNSSLIPPLRNWLKKIKPKWIILDPVLRSSSRYTLLDEQGISLLKKELIFEADLITPNLSELGILSDFPLKDLRGMQKAAKKILEKSFQKKSKLKWILAKGGHLKNRSTDLLIGKNKISFFGKKRIPSKNVHGTGCTLASAIAGYLFKGKDISQAIWLASRVVLKKIKGN